MTLKVSRVVPVYKKGDRSMFISYHPIAIVPVVAKVLIEAIIKVQLF